MNNDSRLVLKNIKYILDNIQTSFFAEETNIFLDNFKSLPVERQLELFDELYIRVKFEYHQLVNFNGENSEVCKDNNHLYSPWYEGVSFKNYRGSTFRNRVWRRTCLKCGDVDITFVKPLNSFVADDYINKEGEKISKKLVKKRK